MKIQSNKIYIFTAKSFKNASTKLSHEAIRAIKIDLEQKIVATYQIKDYRISIIELYCPPLKSNSTLIEIIEKIGYRTIKIIENYPVSLCLL